MSWQGPTSASPRLCRKAVLVLWFWLSSESNQIRRGYQCRLRTAANSGPSAFFAKDPTVAWFESDHEPSNRKRNLRRRGSTRACLFVIEHAAHSQPCPGRHPAQVSHAHPSNAPIEGSDYVQRRSG